MLTSWSTITTATASGRSARRASCAAFSEPALPVPTADNTRPGTYLSSMGVSAASPQAKARMSTTFRTTVDYVLVGCRFGHRPCAISCMSASPSAPVSAAGSVIAGTDWPELFGQRQAP